MEYFSYVSLIGIAFCFILLNKKAPLVFFVFLFILFLLIVRFSGFDVDIAKYAKWMTADFEGITYYKEILYFIFSRKAYQITGNEIYAFWLLDIIWCLVTILALRIIFADKKDAYMCFAILALSFPVILGFENLHRQHMATAFTLLAYALSISGVLRSSFVVVLASLFHNSVLLSMPVLLGKKLANLSVGVRALIIFVLIMFLFSALLILSSGGGGDLQKSNESTGLNLSVVYILLFFLIILFSIFVNDGSFQKSFVNFTSTYTGFFLVIFMVILFNDTPAERVGQLFLVLSVPDILNALKNYAKTTYNFLAAILLLCLSIPMLVFSNAESFLL